MKALRFKKNLNYFKTNSLSFNYKQNNYCATQFLFNFHEQEKILPNYNKVQCAGYSTTLDDLLEELKKKELERKKLKSNDSVKKSVFDEKENKGALQALSNIVKGEMSKSSFSDSQKQKQQQKNQGQQSKNDYTQSLSDLLSSEKKQGSGSMSNLLQQIFTEEAEEKDKAEKLEEEENFEDSAHNLFGPESKNLKHFNFYPKKVKEWVVNAKFPKGFWNESGLWDSAPLIAKGLKESGAPDVNLQSSRTQLRAEFEKKKSMPLPPELEGKYRFGVTEEELQEAGVNEDVRELFSYHHANKREIHQEIFKQAIQKWGKDPLDSGSSAVQIAIMTRKIHYLADHMKKHHKDKRTQRALQILADKRRKMMKYLKRNNVEIYYSLLKDLNLRDMVSSPFTRTWK